MSAADRKTIGRQVLLAVALSTAAVRADTWTDPDTGYTWNYRLAGDAVEICSDISASAVSPKPEGVAAIPAMIAGTPVTSIGPDAFIWNTELTSVTIPDGVTHIEEGAFIGCGKLQSFLVADGNTSYRSAPGLLLTKNGRVLVAAAGGLVNATIPTSVTSVGAYAFYACGRLASVTIPASVTNIEDWAFTGCENLTQFVVASGNPCYKSESGLLLTKDGTELVAVPGGATNVTIPNGVTSIGAGAFAQCRGLTRVAIPDGVTHVGRSAFDDCAATLYDATSVPGVRLVDGWAIGGTDALSGGLDLTGVRGIGDGAFAGCGGLTSVTVGADIAKVGASAFAGCDNLTSVTMSSGVTDIGESAFAGCGSLASVAMPETVTSVGECAFYGCRSLTRMVIPSAVTRIGNGAFSGCSGVTSVTIPQCVCSSSLAAVFPSAYQSIADVVVADGVESIGASAFAGCSGVTSVTIPDGVASIGNYAFYDCESLANATIPASVTSIGTFAFGNCRALSKISFLGNAPVVDAHTFDAVSSDCSVDVRTGTTGWGVDIPGTWGGMEIAYYSDSPKPEPDPAPPSPLEPAVDRFLYATVNGAAPTSAASEYNGYLVGADGNMKGTIQVKVGKPGMKDRKSSVKATVVIGAKKVTLKASTDKGRAAIYDDGPTAVELVGKGTEACTVVLGAKGLSGWYGDYAIDGARNFFASKDKDEASVAEKLAAGLLGSYNLVWDGGVAAVTVAKKGKAKVSGTLADGTKLTATAQLLIGEEWFCVPVSAVKANLLFTLWLPANGQDARSPSVEGLGDGAAIGSPGALKAGATFNMDVDALEAVLGMDVLPYLPDGLSVEQQGKKWVVADGAKAGKITMKKGEVDDSKAGENPSGLKLTYTASSGTFKGTFKAYAENKGKLTMTTVNVSGVMANGIGYGTATVKSRKGSIAVTIR